MSPYTKKKFSWNNEAVDILLECYNQAQAEARSQQSSVTRLCLMLFQQKYPSYKFTEDQIKFQISSLKRKSETTISQHSTQPQVSKPQSYAWNEERDKRLWELAAVAYSEENLRQITGYYQGFRGRPQGLFKLLWELYTQDQKLEANELSISAVRNRLHKVMEKFPPIQPLPPVSQAIIDEATVTNRLRVAMDEAYNFAKNKIFDACCSVCGAFLWGNVGQGHKFQEAQNSDYCIAEDVFSYCRNLLPTKFRKNDGKWIHYFCASCFKRRPNDYITEKDIFCFYSPERTAQRPAVLCPRNEELSQYCKHQIALVYFSYSMAKKSVPRKQAYMIMKGFVEVLKKTANQYVGMHGFLTGKVDKDKVFDIECETGKRKEEHERVKQALQWLRQHNPLYEYFYANVESLIRYKKETGNVVPFFSSSEITKLFGEFEFGNEETLLRVPAEQAAPLILDRHRSYCGMQHPRNTREAAINMYRFSNALHHYDPDKENKAFPWLYPYGKGGFVRKQGVRRSEFVKQKLLCCDSRWNDDLLWSYYHNNEAGIDTYYHTDSMHIATNKCRDSRLTCGDILQGFTEEEYHVGIPLLHSVSGTADYWKKQTYNLLAMKDFMEKVRGPGKGHPNFFLTLTINESWPEIQAFIRGANVNPDVGINAGFSRVSRGGQPAVRVVTAVTVAAQKRLRFVLNKIRERKPLGEIEEYFIRAEYQNRGAIHWHILLWCKEGTIPSDAVTATFPDGDNLVGPYWSKHRERVHSYQTHGCVIGKCIRRQGDKCKLGFPFPVNLTKRIDDNGVRYLYVRRSQRDQYIVPYNPYILEWLDGHMNVQEVNETHWIDYLVKYTTKLGTYTVKIQDKRTGADKFMRFRDVSKMESIHAAMQFPSVECSREFLYLSTDLDPNYRAIKKQELLMELDPTSTDVFYQSKLQFYLKRPSVFESESYANYYRRYDVSYDRNKRDSVPDPTNNKRRIYRRKNEAIVRWHLKILMKDPVDFALQQLVLHVPFRSEDGSDLFSADNADNDPLKECLIRRNQYPEIQFGNEREMALSFLETSKSKGLHPEKIIAFVNDLAEHGYLETSFCEHYVEELEEEARRRENMLHDWAWQLEAEEDDVDPIDIADSQTADLVQEMIQNGSKGQKEIFEMLTDWAKKEKQKIRWAKREGKFHKKEQKLIFISGGAGCGKTYLIKALMASFRFHNIPYRSAAFTGVASRITQGTTIHELFRLDINNRTRLDPTSIQADILRSLEVLIIDEVSMLPAKLFHLMDQMLCDYRNENCRSNRPFGGRTVILIGDPAQLPTIRGKGIWYEPLFYERFDVYNLTEIKRTRDNRFQRVLNFLRYANKNDEVLGFLKERQLEKTMITDYEAFRNDGFFVSAKRHEKDQFNLHVLNTLEGDVEDYPADDRYENNKLVRRDKIDGIVKASKTLLPTNLKLKIGCRVIVLKNLDSAKGWVNGTIAIVERLERDYIFVAEFHNPSNRKVLLRVQESLQTKRKDSRTVIRTQFPIDLAYGLTIHKTQGLSLPEVYVDMKNAWDSGQIYTAISRCIYPNRLFIINFDESKIITTQYHKELLHWIRKTNLLDDANKRMLPDQHPRELPENKIPIPKYGKEQKPKSAKPIRTDIYPQLKEDEIIEDSDASSEHEFADESSEESGDDASSGSDTTIVYNPEMNVESNAAINKETPKIRGFLATPRKLEEAFENLTVSEAVISLDSSDFDLGDPDADKDIEIEENIRDVSDYTETQMQQMRDDLRQNCRLDMLRDATIESMNLLLHIRSLLKQFNRSLEFEEQIKLFLQRQEQQLLSQRVTTVLVTTNPTQRPVTPDLHYGPMLYNNYHSIYRTHFIAEKTTGNGDCFYNAISLLLFGHERYFHLIRAGCLFAFIRRLDMFKRNMSSTTIRRENTWGLCNELAGKQQWAQNDQIAMAALATYRVINIVNIRDREEPHNFRYPAQDPEFQKNIAWKTEQEVHEMITTGEIFRRFFKVFPWNWSSWQNAAAQFLRSRESLNILFSENHFVSLVPRLRPVTLIPHSTAFGHQLYTDETEAEILYLYQCTRLHPLQL